MDTVELLAKPIDCARALAAVGAAEAGAVALFLGTVRDHHDGRPVSWLEYEAYPAMAERQMRLIAAEMRARWPLARVWMQHRIGRLAIGEASVIVCVSSAHRVEAFAACRHGIDRIKEDVPIWKKEFYADGAAAWIGEAGAESQTRAADARHDQGDAAADP